LRHNTIAASTERTTRSPNREAGTRLVQFDDGAVADRVASYVWLPAPGHALHASPHSPASPAPATLVLPHPLGGSWTADPPVPTVTAAQVARSCAVIGKANLRLEAALAEPAFAHIDPEEDSHVQA
jgi:hypothetical protein